MKLVDRVDKIEAALLTHLEESGSIRTDLAWLKKAFWTITGAVVIAVVALIIRPGVSHGTASVSPVQSVGQRP